MQRLEQFPIAGSAQFIVIASTLLLIKSKSLLPSLVLTEEEAGRSIEDLEERLKLYKRYKELSVYIAERFGKKVIFAKNPSKYTSSIFSR